MKKTLVKSNNARTKRLKDSDKKRLRNKLIGWRIGAVIILIYITNVAAEVLVKLGFGSFTFIAFLVFVFLLFSLDKYLVKRSLDSL